METLYLIIVSLIIFGVIFWSAWKDDLKSFESNEFGEKFHLDGGKQIDDNRGVK